MVGFGVAFDFVVVNQNAFADASRSDFTPRDQIVDSPKADRKERGRLFAANEDGIERVCRHSDTHLLMFGYRRGRFASVAPRSVAPYSSFAAFTGERPRLKVRSSPAAASHLPVLNHPKSLLSPLLERLRGVGLLRPSLVAFNEVQEWIHSHGLRPGLHIAAVQASILHAAIKKVN